MAWALERWLAPYIEGASATAAISATSDATPDHPLIARGDADVASVAGVFARTTPDGWSEGKEERAAIVEYDGGVLRAWAEGFAQLDPSRPPARISLLRWQCFIDDCGHFLDRGWAVQAVALGWGPLELFGCDRKRPYYVPHRGQLWEVNGGRIVALDCDRAIIEIASGDRRIYKRQPLEVGRVVLAWELSEDSG